MDPNAAFKELYNVDVKLCQPFIDAVVSTLKLQCHVEARAGKPGFKDESIEDKSNVYIAANIATESTMGTVTVCFTNQVFLYLMGKMLGETFTTITADSEDGAKELMNVVFNQAKKPLAEKGMAAIRSIPTVIFGSQMRIRYLARSKTMRQPLIPTGGVLVWS